MKWKILWISVAIAALLSAWFAYRGHHQLSDALLATTGIVEGTEVNITSKIAGRISELSGREGTAVQAGEVVLRLEGRDLAAAVRQAQAGVAKAKAEVAVAEASIANLKANLTSLAAETLAAEAEVAKTEAQIGDAKRHVSQMSRLHSANYVAREDLDNATSSQTVAEAGRHAALAALAAAQARTQAAAAQIKMAESQRQLALAGVEQAEADLAFNQAKEADLTVVAPIAGTVVYKALEAGETIAPGLTALTIVDLSHLTVRVDIDESQIDRLRMGDQARILASGRHANPARGRIAAINRYGEFATQKDVTGGRDDLKTFRVTIDVTDGREFLTPGMTVRVELNRQTAKVDHADR